ncbi:MAG: hypothetical protein LQ352_004406 [Teloschistes flavicans]|nr:MAG: hypothetical protein LQ352_004406 [Teloschistes flavicans]
MAPIPITIVTGFLGSGKTTLILNLIPQLPQTYQIALLKNEFGDVAIDSQLAASAAISGVQELLNGCICCNLVGQLGDALETLRKDVSPDRIIIETSGSAFPATLAMEVNRLGRETGCYVLDGVVVVIDVENWKGYEDTSYTAKMQQKYTDLIVFNKWELVDERRYDDCLDRVGDLELQIANVKSDKGRVDQSLLLGLDSALAKDGDSVHGGYSKDRPHHDHSDDHQTEVEVLSLNLVSEGDTPKSVNVDSLETFLLSAPKDEVYRIKALVSASHPLASSNGDVDESAGPSGGIAKYILNWAFGRWTFSHINAILPAPTHVASSPTTEIAQSPKHETILRMTIVLARGEATKWKARIEKGGMVEQEGEGGFLMVDRVV